VAYFSLAADTMHASFVPLPAKRPVAPWIVARLGPAAFLPPRPAERSTMAIASNEATGRPPR